MLCAADTVGVFQVESRAQMATLPRLRPRNFYDLVIEVALIRPGPIQGNSVHPYIRRRHGKETITYPHPKLEEPLKRTLGIPLFQEQLMQIAVAAADFSPAEADQLRRAMGSKRSGERIDQLKRRLYDGMAGNGIIGAEADEIFEKIKAFASFGFAESHSISFAFLVLRLVVAQALPPGRVLRLAAQRAADGVLFAPVAGARREAARGGGARPRHQPLRRRRHARTDRRGDVRRPRPDANPRCGWG